MGRLRKIARYTLLLAAAAVTWIGIVFLAWLADPGDLPAFDTADRLIVSGDAVPADDGPWQRVSLPDDWRDHPFGGREAWYRILLPEDSGRSSPRAVYLPVVMMNAAVYVNGRLIGSGGRFADPVSRNWSRPLVFSLAASTLRPGANALHVHVKSDLDDAGFLGRVHVGDRRALARAHARATFVKRTLVWMLVVARLVLAAFTGAVWWMWRKARYYGWFTLCVLAWVAAELNGLVVDPPVATAAWYWLLYVSIGWWAITSVRLLLSFLDVQKPSVERGTLLVGIVGSAVLALLAAFGESYFHPAARTVWLPIAFLTACLVFRSVIPALRRHPDRIEFDVVFVVAVSILGCVLWDLLMQIGVRRRGGLTVPPYSAAVAIVGMGWAFLRRFIGTLRETQGLVVTLEGRIRDKQTALDASYAKIRDVDRARVLSEERERIMREMHDGLGSHLVSTLAMIEGDGLARDTIAPAVRAALDELRLAVDALDPIEGDLLAALAMLRARLGPRLETAGLRVHWEVEELPPLVRIGPEKTFQLLRILQEIFTNVVRHARARTVSVRTGIVGPPASGIFIEVADDGVGMREDAVAGRGLGNMRRRAAAVGASLDVASSAGGTRVRITLPAEERSTAAPGAEG